MKRSSAAYSGTVTLTARRYCRADSSLHGGGSHPKFRCGEGMTDERLVHGYVIGKEGLVLIMPKTGSGNGNPDDADTGGDEGRGVTRTLRGG